MVKQIFKINFYLILIFALIITSINISAQNSLSDLPPQVLNQLKTMTPDQQQQLAERYKIRLPTIRDQDDNFGELGQNADPIEKFIVNERDEGSSDSLEFDLLSSRSIDDEKPQRFGLSFFSQEISTFSPVDDISVPDNYVLGIGDSLTVQMMGTTTDRYDLEIARDGTIYIESLGVISIAGSSLKQATEMIETRVVNELFGTTVSINIGKLKAMNIFLSGEIKYPGMYSVSALTTLTQALYQAGGITEQGSIRNIQVIRNGKNINSFDAYDLLIKGDSTNDIRLKSGDVVLISPYKSIAEVKGETRRPMLYEILNGETVADLIKMSSGFAENASLSESVLLTQTSPGSPLNALTLNLLDENDLNTILGMNDTLIIPKANIAPRNYIEISGAAHGTGLLGWHKGMKLTDIITDANKDFPNYIDLDFSMIVRKPDRFSELTFLKFSLRELFQEENFIDIELLEYDHILFFSTTPEDIVDESDERNILNEDLLASSSLAGNRRINQNNEALVDSSLNNESYKNNKKDNYLISNKELSEESKKFTRKKLIEPFIELVKLNSSLENPANLVSILGAVPYPGIYPLFEGASANDLIEAAGGFSNTAYIDAIELRRQKLESFVYSTESIEINASKNQQQLKSTKLRPLDHITVREYSGLDDLNTIKLSGEFIFPGEYIINRNESILSVIERAGGFTKNAFIEGSVYTNALAKTYEIERIEDYSNQIKRNFSSSSLTQENSSSIAVLELNSIIEMLQSVEPSGRVSIDLNGDNIEDFKVANGDTLHIPSKISTVSVVGEVNVNNSLEYNANYSIDDYLQMSGGLTKRADKDSLYIVKANGSTLVLDKTSFRLFGRKPIIGPGDTIVAPINIQYKDSITNWTQVTQLIYQSMVSIAAVKGL